MNANAASSAMPEQIPPKPDRDEPSRLPFPVVGIGASAGGLSALQRFFEQMPAQSGMAFVVILHLSPNHESSAAAILQQATRMPVREVGTTMAIEIDHVYVIPPTKHLSMEERTLRVSNAPPRVGRHVAIDLFFRTLAAAHRERAIAIVLSGSGSDGAVGLTRLKEEGGLTLVQDPDDAEYDGMPRAAIGTDQVDFVLPVVEMPQRLLELAASARGIRLPPPHDGMAVAMPDASADAETALKEIQALVKKRTGYDFAAYKRSMLLRRLERRLQVRMLHSLPAYRDDLVAHPEEVDALLQDLLVSVTNFFRDHVAFEALEREVLPLLLDGRVSGEPIRVWVAGCATGEEAYSIAMQLHDLGLGRHPRPDFQIFATDIDERALAVARTGAYPLSIVTDVSAARLRRFFTRDGDKYRVSKALRERVVFARHNLLGDAPFSRVDLVTCRNVLIYLDRDAQKRSIDTFRFALRANGFLFLGSSESIETSAASFIVHDKRHRFYRVSALPGARPAMPPLRDPGSSPLAPLRILPASERERPRFEVLHQQATELFSPPSVLIDASHQILHLSHGAGKFLEHAGGVPSHNLLAIVHPALRLELRAALFKSRQSGKSVEAHTVAMHRDGTDFFVNVVVRPFKGRDGDLDLVVVVFVEVEDALRPAGGEGTTGDGSVVEQLEAELKRHKEQLQESLEQADTSTEELRASNEELQAINEEMQAASEELETGKEELQSMNEELVTVNDELKTRIEETGKVNDDLLNLVASTEIATIFVDHALRIKRYTPRALELFSLIPTDVGRSLLDIRHRLQYDELAKDASEVFRTLHLIEREVQSETGSHYLVRVLPYRTTADVIDGATITFVDVTGLRQAEARARESEVRLRLAAATTKDFAIMTMDDAGMITTWNDGAERMFGYLAHEIVGRSGRILFTPEDRAAGVPEQELVTARTQGRAEDDRWHLRKDNTRFYCSGVVTPFESGDLHGLAKIARDITGMRSEQTRRDALLVKERETRAQYEAAIRLKDEFLAVMSHELKHPLNLIHVNAELLSRLPQLRGVPAAVRAAQVIRETVVGQGKIIDDLLDLSRARTGKLALQIAPVDLAKTIETIVDAVRADADDRQLVLDWSAGEVGLVACDPIRAEQIAWNLLSNALKFTPQGGRVEVRLEADGAFARLTVTDDGKGISAAFLPHVFDMFGQEQHAASRSEGGLGIGLALVNELTRAQGGHVEARSDGVGRGARFTVWLPLFDANATAGADARSAAATPSLAGLRVLIVEDSRDAIEPFLELLRLEGADPTAAHAATDALERLEHQDFDLIVSDIGMPGMSGYEFIAEVRRRKRSAAIPAIALTGFGRGNDKRQALEAGFDAHVTKPASILDLRHALASLRKPGSPPPSAKGRAKRKPRRD